MLYYLKISYVCTGGYEFYYIRNVFLLHQKQHWFIKIKLLKISKQTGKKKLQSVCVFRNVIWTNNHHFGVKGESAYLPLQHYDQNIAIALTERETPSHTK